MPGPFAKKTRSPRKPPHTRTRGPHRQQERPAARGALERLYGINPVRTALEQGRRRLDRLYLKQGRLSEKLSALAQLAGERGLPVTEATPAELEDLSGSASHQGVMLECGPLPLAPERQALETASSGTPLLVALDEVEDPQNLGAIARCAAAFGAAGLVLPRHHSAPAGAAASKASAGTLESLPVFEAANLARFLDQARRKGFWVAGSVVEQGTPLDDFEHDQPLVLVLGNEGRGLRPLVRSQCDYLISIPLGGGGSLNVATAAAIMLYRLSRPRKP